MASKKQLEHTAAKAVAEAEAANDAYRGVAQALYRVEGLLKTTKAAWSPIVKAAAQLDAWLDVFDHADELDASELSEKYLNLARHGADKAMATLRFHVNRVNYHDSEMSIEVEE